MPTIDDLSVYRGRYDDTFDVSSHLTRGRCATVYKWTDGRYHVQPLLIGSYMQGITTSLIIEAVKLFESK